MPDRSHLFTPRTPGKALLALSPRFLSLSRGSQQQCSHASDHEMPRDPGALTPSSPGDSHVHLGGR